jgi:hypothetical protein
MCFNQKNLEATMIKAKRWKSDYAQETKIKSVLPEILDGLYSNAEG